MGTFSQPILVKLQPGKMILTQDWFLPFEEYNILIKTGATTDGDSIPTALLRKLLNRPFQEHVLLAALVHDMLYATHIVPREEADELYYRLLLYCGYNKEKAMVKYYALRIFGWYRWNQVTPASMEHAMLYIRFSKGCYKNE